MFYLHWAWEIPANVTGRYIYIGPRELAINVAGRYHNIA